MCFCLHFLKQLSELRLDNYYNVDSNATSAPPSLHYPKCYRHNIFISHRDSLFKLGLLSQNALSNVLKLVVFLACYVAYEIRLLRSGKWNNSGNKNQSKRMYSDKGQAIFLTHKRSNYVYTYRIYHNHHEIKLPWALFSSIFCLLSLGSRRQISPFSKQLMNSLKYSSNSYSL